MLVLALTLLFGSPRALFEARVADTMSKLCPCTAEDGACAAKHARYAGVIATTAWRDKYPDDAAARLLGTAAHETCFRTETQVRGPAVTVWQIEERDPVKRADFLREPLRAAERALHIAQGCDGGMRGYATGTCFGGGARGAEVAGQLRACVESARAGGEHGCRSWRAAPKRRRR